MNDSTRRFSNRVDNYVRYRRGYPPTLIDFLRDECQLRPGSVVADVGSGTGQLAELFLRNGNLVYGIEPNREMRLAAERYLKDYPRFWSIEAMAESTTLNSHTVDVVAVGRAFHWFDFEKALCEFSRILKPEGWIVVVWLRRRMSSLFLVEFDELLKTYANEYQDLSQRRIRCINLLTERGFKQKTQQDQNDLDFESLKGQTLSYSVTPEAGDPNYGLMMEALSSLFRRHQRDARVTFEYDLVTYYGHPQPANEG
jgi:ubiquinone/menaquinone biosynthesis C-methylase UbiE